MSCRPIRLRLLLCLIIGTGAFCLLPAVKAAPPSAAPATSAGIPTAAPAATTPIGKQLGQSFQALIAKPTAPPVAGGTATPAPLATAPAAAPAAPAASTTTVGTGTAAPAAGDTSGDDADEGTPTATFGSRALNFVIVAGEFVGLQAQTFVTNFAALPQLSGWYDAQTVEPHRTHWLLFWQNLLHIISLALTGAILLELIFYPLRRRLYARPVETAAQRYGTIAGFMALRAVPIVLFVGLATTLLEEADTRRLGHFMILNVVYAVILGRVAITLLRGLLAPTAATAPLRLVPHLATAQAASFFNWLCAFSLVIIFGYFFVVIAQSVHVPDTALAAFLNLLGGVLVGMTVTLILQKRALIATLLRGTLSAAQPDLTTWQTLRLWLARRWHILAISYIGIGYSIAALGVRNGFSLLLRGTVLSVLILTVLSYALRAVNRYFAKDSGWSSTNLHYAALLIVIRIVLWLAALAGIAWAWGGHVDALFATTLGHRILGSTFSIAVTVAILALIYQLFSSMIERRLSATDDQGNTVEASARMRTLLPMVRNTLLIICGVVVGFVILSEAGVNVAPLLAGAGVVGVAVGFGSQTLVKDFLTGLFIVIENTMAIGDVVKIGSHAGVVEAMNMRSVKLRDGDGAIHTLAFSEVTQVINMTRDFGMAAFSINVAFDTDLEHAMDVLRTVGEGLRNDPVFKRAIVQPIEILGVDAIGASFITLLAQIKTQAGKHWDVKRMFLLRMKQAFDKEGIVMPYPTTVSIQRRVGPDTMDEAEANAAYPPPNAEAVKPA